MFARRRTSQSGSSHRAHQSEEAIRAAFGSVSGNFSLSVNSHNHLRQNSSKITKFNKFGAVNDDLAELKMNWTELFLRPRLRNYIQDLSPVFDSRVFTFHEGRVYFRGKGGREDVGEESRQKAESEVLTAHWQCFFPSPFRFVLYYNTSSYIPLKNCFIELGV